MKGNILFVGIGVIGGSIARDLCKEYSCCALTQTDELSGSFHDIFHDYAVCDSIKAERLIVEADMICIATPFEAYYKILQCLSGFNLDKKIVFECGSIKTYPSILKKEFPFLQLTHPIAGSEKSGFENSTHDLFKDKLIILDDRNIHNNEIAEALYNCHFRTYEVLSAQMHDLIFCYTSHMPQLLSYIFDAFIVKCNLIKEDKVLQEKHNDYKLFRRLAGSNKAIWCGKFGTLYLNYANIDFAMNKFIDIFMLYKSNNILDIARNIAKVTIATSQKYLPYYGSGIKDFTQITNGSINFETSTIENHKFVQMLKEWQAIL